MSTVMDRSVPRQQVAWQRSPYQLRRHRTGADQAILGGAAHDADPDGGKNRRQSESGHLDRPDSCINHCVAVGLIAVKHLRRRPGAVRQTTQLLGRHVMSTLMRRAAYAALVLAVLLAGR